MFRFLSLLLISLFTLNIYAQTIPGQQLLDVFGANCPGQGKWTRAALNDATALIEVLRTIKDDPNCQTVAGAISNLSNLKNRVTQINELNGYQLQIAEYNKQEQLLLTQIGVETNPDYLLQLQSSLAGIQQSRATIESNVSARNEHLKPKQEVLLSQAIDASNAAFNQIISNQECINKNPSVVSASATLVGSVASAAAIGNPALSLGLSAAADFLGNILENARKNKLARQMRKIARGTVALEGYKCALQTLSSRWCSINDAEKFLDLRANLQHAPIDPDLLNSIKLSQVEGPVLLNWLNNIRSGVKASTSADAARQARVIQRESRLRVQEVKYRSMISENEELFNKAVDDQDRWGIIRNVLGKILEMRYEGERSSGMPLFEIYEAGYAPYYMLGIAREDRPVNSDGDPISFDSFDPFTQWPSGDYKPVYNPLLITQLEAWVARARKRVNDEFSLILQPDSIQLISSAYDKTNGPEKVSTKEALVRIIEFFETNQPEKFLKGAYKKLFDDFLKDLKNIDQNIDEVLYGDKEARVAVSEIYLGASLEFGTSVVQSRLSMLIRAILFEKIKESDPTDQNIVAQLLAAGRFEDVLSSINGSDSLSAIKADILRAKPIAQVTLQEFTEIFRKNLIGTFKFLLAKEKKARPIQKAQYQRSRTELCLGILAAEFWPEKLPVTYCTGLKLEPILKGGPSSPVITSRLIHGPMEKRACIYQDYMRESFIYERWNIK